MYKITFEEESKIQGWSPIELMEHLNRSVKGVGPGAIYLEIGTFCGRSLAAALKGNITKAVVIDPLDLWTGNGFIRDIWNQTVDKFNLRDRITLFQQKSEDFSGELPPVNVFFYDGNHDSGHTYEALCKYEKYLANNAAIIVDDYNIYGGNQQTPFPGHQIDLVHPVKTDVDRWVAENKDKVRHVSYKPWLNGQAIITYERL